MVKKSKIKKNKKSLQIADASNNIRKTSPWRTRPVTDPVKTYKNPNLREFYDPLTGMRPKDFQASAPSKPKKKKRKKNA